MGNIQYRFDKKLALVTGGAAGIGLQIAHDFLAAGASVAVWDYSQDALKTAQEELKQYGGRVSFTQVDVSQWNSCAAAAANLPGKVDVLVNNAGITRDKSFAKMTPEDFNAVISTNLSGIFNVTKSIFEHFTDSPNKRIINISSVVALYGNFGQTNYVAAKAGVIGITKTLSKELAKKGFTVNAVAPGFTMTSMVAKMPKDVLDTMASKVPAARLGKTEDISNACLFLASEEASYITGTVLSVDGGLVV